MAASTLRRFYTEAKHERAAGHIEEWIRKVKAGDWKEPNDIQQDIPLVRLHPDGRATFNLRQNEFRLVVHVNYETKIVYIRFVGTHADYDRILNILTV